MSVKYKSSAQRSAECFDATMKKLNGFSFTVILKSGVKIGVDKNVAEKLWKFKSVSDNKIDGIYFVNSEIAAIVPTENIIS